MTKFKPRLCVLRVLSNNAVLAKDDEGHELVALGKGLGFGRRPKDMLDAERIEQVFIAGGDEASHRVTQFLADVPLVAVRAAAAAAEIAHERLAIKVTQGLILLLADHIDFALTRHKDGMFLEVPLRWEIRTLYPAEYAAGEYARQKINAMLGVDFPTDEAVSLAMHFVNAGIANPGQQNGLSIAMQMTLTISKIMKLIEHNIHISINQDSMGAARFVTHLRYLFTRIASGKQYTGPELKIIDSISSSYPEAVACAQKVRSLIESEMKTTLSNDEEAYLAIHIARLTAGDHGG